MKCNHAWADKVEYGDRVCLLCGKRKDIPGSRDVCECGDYRYQHENGTGKCRMPDDMSHGFKPCLAFKRVFERLEK